MWWGVRKVAAPMNLARKSEENGWRFKKCTLIYTEADIFVEKMIRHVMLVNHRRGKVMSFFLQKKINIILWCQIDF